ncbi:S9 family peptidase [Neptunicella marina]|uniref:S9 family peptidase n=1 Tax=Neptunicella marina TaxID=2125989 RepID=A0A8J6IUM3_9ALTE|nr:S9 family peptidase [Neptunicella marina]MBC3766155.1 S9 family peptidase [Neptunicella marina]
MIKSRPVLGLLMAVTMAGCSSTMQPAPQSVASADTSSQITLEDLYKNKKYDAKRLGSVRWMEDGTSYTSVEKAEGDTDAKDIVRYDAGSDKREVLVSAKMLTPEGQEKALEIDDYQWNSDQTMLMIYTNSKKVWRSNSRGDYWLLDMKSGKLTQLGLSSDDVEPATMMFAKFSPNDKAIAYVRNNNLYSQSLQDYSIKQLTTDGKGHIINGIFDWVYEEEFSIADGFRWSPDGKHIAYWQLDTSNVRDFTMINNTDELYPTLTVFPYPKAGEKNSTVRIGVVNVSNAKTRWADIPADTDDFYIPRMGWAGNDDEIVVQKVNRLQNTNDHYLVNIHTGKAKEMFVDKDDAFLERYYDVEWLNDGQNFLKISERDGWRHIYLVSRDGKTIKNLTPGEFDIISIVHVDKAAGKVYFTAGKDSVLEQYLYSASLDGKGDITRITPAEFKGNNSYKISPDGKLAVHYFSNVRTPTQYSIISLPDHKNIRTLIDNHEVKEEISKLALADHEFFRVPSYDGTELDGFIMRPANFDPKKKYPIIFYVYGEPAGQTVKNSWGGSLTLFNDYLTQQGFLVASIDNRGTRSPRGREWRKDIYRHIGTYASKDQATALDEMAKRFPYIDTSRVGIWGHSGGGSMTLNMMFRYPDKYKAGIAVAPVPDIRLYDTIYQERYMGLPDTFTTETGREAYNQASPITFAENLKGKLLLIHGTGDDNVHYQGSERLINKLVEYNKQFEFMSYPNRSHSLREGKGTSLHRMTMQAEFFKKNLMN